MKDNHIKITEGLAIASLPVAAYFLSYVFELGYCRFYNIPSLYIDISIINIVSTIIAVLSTYALFFFLFNSLVHPFFENVHRSIKWSLRKISFIIFVSVGFAIISNWSLSESLQLVLPVAGIVIFLEFGFPLLTQSKTHGYIKKLEAQKELDFKHDDILDKFIKKYGPMLFSIFFVFYILSMATYFAGGIKARFQTEHLVSINSPNIVYLRKYGQYLIGSKFDRNKKMLLNELVVEVIGTQKVKLENLGQLVPFEEKKPNNKLNQTGTKEAPPG